MRLQGKCRSVRSWCRDCEAEFKRDLRARKLGAESRGITVDGALVTQFLRLPRPPIRLEP